MLKDGTRVVTTERRYQPPDWYADAWMLERRDPDRWGRRVRVEPPPVPATAPSKIPDLLGVLTQIWVDKVPRRRPAAEVEGDTGAR